MVCWIMIKMNDDKFTLKHVIIEAEIPAGVAIGDLSRSYPDTLFNITNGHWISKDERILYITSKEWKKHFFDFLKVHKGVKNINQIGSIVRIHIKSAFLKKFEQKDMTIIYPTTLKNGFHRIEFLIDKNQYASLKKALPNVKIVRIADSYKEEVNLTERQREILWKAYSFGYFKYPRGITLTDLAKLLNISKATLSSVLRTIENKAIKHLMDDNL